MQDTDLIKTCQYSETDCDKTLAHPTFKFYEVLFHEIILLKIFFHENWRCHLGVVSH